MHQAQHPGIAAALERVQEALNSPVTISLGLSPLQHPTVLAIP